MSTRFRFLALGLSLALASCEGILGEGPSQIRLENASAYTLSDVTFSAGHEPLHFASLAPGERTAYVTVERAYRYGYLEVVVEGERQVLQPIDYVGEEPIGEGHFTFRIAISAGGLRPGVVLVRDD